MAKCFVCPKCGTHLDWNEQYSHVCEEPEQASPKEKVEKVYDRNDPATVAAREEVMKQIYNLQQKN